MMVQMETTWLKFLISSIDSFLHIPSAGYLNLDLVQSFYKTAEEILNLLKPTLESLVDSETGSNELINNVFEELSRYVNTLQEAFESWQPISSKVYFALQAESLISKLLRSGLDIFELLRSLKEHLPDELDSSFLEHRLEKLKQMEQDTISTIMEEALHDQRDGIELSPETLFEIAEILGLKSNQEILIEAILLENLKESAELAEKNAEAEYIDQLVSLVIRFHDHFVKLKQSQTCSPVPIPPDFCCPLSLELMTDPVIVSSGQTYERVFIEKWIDMGLMVCPKTRQVLSTTLIPNYTVKAFITNWCEVNDVKPLDPLELISKQSSPLLVRMGTNDLVDEQNGDDLSSSGSNLSAQDDSTMALRSNSANGVQPERASPVHSHSLSEASPSGIVRNGKDLKFTTALHSGSEDGSISDENDSEILNRKRLADSIEHEDASSSSSGIITPIGTHQNLEIYEEADMPSQPPRDPSRLSTGSGHQRSPSQTTWHNPSERLMPRIIASTAIEIRTDLSEIVAEVRNLIEGLKSPSMDDQRNATADIRLLARISTDNRIVIANCGAITYLVNLLHSSDLETQENAVTALLNLSLNHNNKSAIADAGAIEPLIHVLDTGNPEAKENSAATLFSLSSIDENRIRIGNSGAIPPLVDLLANGTLSGKKDAATALFNLSLNHENKIKIIQSGAVRHLIELMDPSAGMVDKAVVVLANLTTIHEGRVAIGQEGGIPALVEVVELGSARGKENAAAGLLQLCNADARFCNMVLKEGGTPPVLALTQSGTARAREKAQALLTCFKNHRHVNASRR